MPTLQSALRGLAYGGTISYVAFAKPFAEGFNTSEDAKRTISITQNCFLPRVQRALTRIIRAGTQTY